MELSHKFTVPTGVEETWAHFQDIASVAECFPGAKVTEADEQSFSGSVKVKLGPIALVYNGSGTFVEKDEVAHRFVVDAKGKDKRGNGTAGAHVTVSMTDSATDGGGATDVAVDTDLAITGKPAQFGRGVMQDVSDKLLGQFVACLEQRLSPQVEETAPAAVSPLVGETAPTPVSPLLGETAPTSVSPLVGEGAQAPVSKPGGTASAPEPTAAPPPRVEKPPPAQPEALDLGAAVLPILAKTYWKQAVGALIAIAILWRLITR